MNELTEKDIRHFMKSLWPDVNITVSITKNINIALESDYGSVGISFDKLLKMVEFFGTKNIDIDNSFSSGGCQTCSYGDSHTLEFTVKP